MRRDILWLSVFAENELQVLSRQISYCYIFTLVRTCAEFEFDHNSSSLSSNCGSEMRQKMRLIGFGFHSFFL